MSSPMLNSLPNELLDNIISFVPAEPHSCSPKSLRRIPSRDIASNTSTPLKSLSRVDSKWHSLSAPWLFRHARFQMGEEKQFLVFIHANGLAKYVRSVCVSTENHPDESSGRLWWKDLLRDLDPGTITIIAPPQTIGDLVSCRMDGKHTWAFAMPLHILQLHQRSSPCAVPEQKLQGEEEKEEEEEEGEKENKSLLTARRWTGIAFNEGSFLRAYRNYEYFHLTVPSFLDTWGRIAERQPAVLPFPINTVNRLTSFDYVAVFPFYTHTNLVLEIVQKMDNLRRLSFQLAPTKDSTILEQERASGALDPQDPWMELETSYAVAAQHILRMGHNGRLVEFQTYDIEHGDLAENIIHVLERDLGMEWAHDGYGIWSKRDIPLTENASADDDPLVDLHGEED